jgi:methyl-accepting chemotaxis protein
MTTTNPDQLRREIEETQRGLSTDVNALTEKVTPSRIVQRRVGRARRAITGMKTAIMGTVSDTTSAASGRMGTAASSVADTVTSAAETVGDAPAAARRGTQGNPLAAGLIAFGLGWLTASLLPPSKREQKIADQTKDLAQEHIVPVAGDLAEQLKDNLQQPAEQAVESIKSTAQDAGSTVADETRSATEDITGQVHDAKDRVTEQATSSGQPS